MELPQIPQDDLMDVMEITEKLEEYISTIFKDHDKNLSVSALMSATINCLLAQCKTLDEVMFYRNLFIQTLDSTISHIEIKGTDREF